MLRLSVHKDQMSRFCPLGHALPLMCMLVVRFDARLVGREVG